MGCGVDRRDTGQKCQEESSLPCVTENKAELSSWKRKECCVRKGTYRSVYIISEITVRRGL